MTFASKFSARFVGGGYVCPVTARDLLVCGAPVVFERGTLTIAGRVLMGIAGKVYEFRSEASAAEWCNVAAQMRRRECDLLAGADYAQAWRERKRRRLSLLASQCLENALVQEDAAKRAALVDEALTCGGKWL